VVVGARALLSLPSGMQLSARNEVDGWMLVAWRVPKYKGAFEAEYDYVEAPAPWRNRRFSTTDELLEAMEQTRDGASGGTEKPGDAVESAEGYSRAAR
jgi:hypothetical protein